MIKHYTLLIACFLGAFMTQAQVNYVTTYPPLNGGNGQSGITFNVKAINAITVKEISAVFGSTGSHSVTVWYHPTDSINGLPTVNTTNGWISLGPYTVNVTTTSALTQIANNLNIAFSPNTVHGFHIATTGTITYTTGPTTQMVFGDLNMYINTGTNCGYGGSPPSSSFYIREFCGEIGYTAGPPCPSPGGLNVTNITSKTADFSWNAVSGSVGYEYAITTSATPPGTAGTATTLTSASTSTLTPSTQYYLYVRNKCSGGGISQWIQYPFMTLPPCKPPIGFKVTNLTPTSATINWDPWPSALSYDYLVDQSRNDPTSPTGITNIPTTSDNIGGLSENTWYYVHILSRCYLGEISNWSLDSFLTPIPCRPPVIKIDHINTDEAVAYWDKVPTAQAYEYAITTSSTPPALGTKYLYNTLHTSALYDGKDYYIHVRSQCNSLGIEGISDWATASFRTFPVSVGAANGESFSVAVAPNPARTQATVTIKGSNDRNGTIEITDLSGRLLLQMSAIDNTVVVNTNNLASGVYLLKYKDSIHSQVLRLVKE